MISLTSLAEFTEATQNYLSLEYERDRIKRQMQKASETMLAYLEEQNLVGQDIQIRHLKYRVHKVQSQTVIYQPESVIEAVGVVEAANIMTVSPGPCRDLIELLVRKGRSEAAETIQFGMEVKDKAPYIKVSVVKE